MTKREKNIALGTGIGLFAVAALFSVSLISGLFDYGNGGSWISVLGKMLISVYGICSILIPAFFFVAGIFSFSSRWSFNRALGLIISLIPFFTLVLAERRSRAIYANDSSAVAFFKIFILIAIAVLMVAVEYLAAFVLAAKIRKYRQQKLLKNEGVSLDSVSEEEAEEIEDREKESSENGWALTDVIEGKDEPVLDSTEWSQAEEDNYTEENDDDIWSLDDNGNLKSQVAANGGQVESPEESEASAESDTDVLEEFNKDFGQEKNLTAEDWDLMDNAESTSAQSELHATDTISPAEDSFEAEEALPASDSLPAENASETEDSLPAEDSLKTEIALPADDSSETEEALQAEDSFPAGDALPAEDSLSADDMLPADAPQATEDSPAADDDYLDVDFDFSAEDESEAPVTENGTGTAKPESVWQSNVPENIEVVELRDIVEQPSQNESQTDDGRQLEDYSDDDIIAQFESGSIGFEEDEGQDSKNEKVEFEINFDEPEADFDPENFDGPRFEHVEEPQESESDIPEIETVQVEDTVSFDEVKTDDEEDRKAWVQEKKTELKLNNALGSIFSRMENDARNAVEEAAPEITAEVLAQAESKAQEEAGSQSAENKYPVGAVAVHTDKNGVTKPISVVPKKRHGPYKIPTDILTEYGEDPYWVIDDETNQAAANLMETLKEFKIEAQVTGIKKGPVVTMFEILPAPGVNLNKIRALQDNITLRLAAKSVRIVAPIPGKRAVGIEIPNKKRAVVSFRECIEENNADWKKMAVPCVLGKDIEGTTQLMDLAKTPHLLIAGATGAGKSVCVNSMILSILYKRSPNDVKLILIDPKIVELSLYNGIGHLLTPVITEPKMAMQALQYCICEMERRYAVLKGMGCREIVGYNQKIKEQNIAAEKLPYIVIVIDEFADLMAVTGKTMEAAVARLAAKSRAVGIHLVLATQRPSVDVITGLIKANIPSRIAFMVASRTDSNIIIDKTGAEKLLGKGDMLYASATDPFPVRIQGTLVSDQEVENVVDAVKDCWGEPEYIDDEIFVPDEEEEESQPGLFSDGADDPLYEKALDVVVQAGKASASYVQRRLSIGYNRAARLIELMEERGIVGPANGSKPREIIHIP